MRLYIILFSMVLSVVVLCSVGFFYLNQEQGSSNSASTKSAKILNPGTYAAYASVNEKDSNAIDIMLYNKETELSKSIYSIQMPESTSHTLFNTMGGTIEIMRIGGNEKSKIIDLNGTVLDQYDSSPYSAYLASPDGQKVAYSKYNAEKQDISFHIDDVDSKGSLELDIDSDFWKPILWTSDNAYVYVEKAYETELRPTDLMKIDTKTGAISNVDAVNSKKLANYSMDNNLYAYGIVGGEFDYFNNVIPTQIYKIQAETGTTETFKLKNSNIGHLYGVNGDGSYMAYSNILGKDDRSAELWVYDFKNHEEIKVSDNTVSSKNVVWNDNILLFDEVSKAEDSNIFYEKLFDADTQKVTTIHTVSSSDKELNNVIQTIGWFQVD